MKIGEYTVIQNPHLLDRVFTKKQTRKFKNHRWVKKYEKNHSYMTPNKDAMVSEINKVIFVHPAMYQLLRLEVDREAFPSLRVHEANEYSFRPTFVSPFGRQMLYTPTA